MNYQLLYNCIELCEESAVPKYLQVANGIIDAMRQDIVKPDDLLPSINELTFNLEISRPTAEIVYKHLKSYGYIESVPSKGFFAKALVNKPIKKILLLFDKISAQRKILYDAFVSSFDDEITIELFVYHNDYARYKSIINDRRGYQYYVVIPCIQKGNGYVNNILYSIPKNKLLILNRRANDIEGDYATVSEDFGKDIYNALLQARGALIKYHTIKFIFPDTGLFPLEILEGFNRFCRRFGFIASVIKNIAMEMIREGEVYINILEEDLVVLIERLQALDLTPGKEVGIISYNETPLKRIIANGITTVSADFQQMGLLAARLIHEGSPLNYKVPFHLTLRNSL